MTIAMLMKNTLLAAKGKSIDKFQIPAPARPHGARPTASSSASGSGGRGLANDRYQACCRSVACPPWMTPSERRARANPLLP